MLDKSAILVRMFRKRIHREDGLVSLLILYLIFFSSAESRTCRSVQGLWKESPYGRNSGEIRE
jgi:hypothetical protein